VREGCDPFCGSMDGGGCCNSLRERERWWVGGQGESTTLILLSRPGPGAVCTLSCRMATLDQIQVLLDRQKNDLKTELIELLDVQKKDLIKEIDARLHNALKPLTTQVSILSGKLQNASLSRGDAIVKVPKADGALPESDTPESIMNLIVAGNESLPNGQLNKWSKQKSIKLLREYGVEADDASDNENEFTERSRTARLKVARALGISNVQLNYAQLSL